MKCLEKVRDALLTVTDNVGHYESSNRDGSYIVWAEDGGGNTLGADNCTVNRAVQGTIDLYTTDEWDPYVAGIESALKAAKISHRLNSVQYEDGTKLIHYEWVFEVA